MYGGTNIGALRHHHRALDLTLYSAYDTVTRPDSAVSPGTASEKGGAWVVGSGTAGVTNGKLYAVGVANTRITLGSLDGSSNGTVQATLQTDDWTNHPVDMMTRFTDIANYLGVVWTSATAGSVRTMIGGVLTAFATWTPTPNLVVGQSYVMSIKVNGTNCIVLQDGVQQANFTLTGGAATILGTGAGIWWAGASTTLSTADNYSVR